MFNQTFILIELVLIENTLIENILMIELSMHVCQPWLSHSNIYPKF